MVEKAEEGSKENSSLQFTTENKNVALEQVKKNEVIEIKLEPVELYSESFGVHEITWGLTMKYDNHHGNIEGIVPNRLKNEHNYAKEWIQCDVKNEEVVEMQLEEIKLEKELNIAKLDVTQITEELILKNDTDCDIFMDQIVCNRISTECADTEEGATFTPTAALTNIEKLFKIEEMDLEMFMDIKNCQDIDSAQFSHDHSSANAKPDILLKSAVKRKIPEKHRHGICKKGSKKSFSCYNCSYTAYHKHHLISHMKGHKNPYLHSSIFKNDLPTHMLKQPNTARRYKVNLDNHIASVSTKIHKCPHCIYETTSKKSLARHMLQHPETAGHPETSRSYKLSTCIHCNATFKSKFNLDDHTVKKHTDFIASVSRKIHECTRCTYKTIRKDCIDRHMLQHSETAGSYKLSTCIHCNATFKKKQSLDDHIFRKHPNFIASVSSKIHKCPHCIYKTTLKRSISRHMLQHPETVGSYKFSTCIHCNLKFKSKQSLDDHIVKRHPNFIDSVSSKMYKCLHCTYTSTFTSNLNNHIVSKHPDFIPSKIHKCPHCTFAATSKGSLARHMLKHPKTAGRHKLSTCIHCNATFSKKDILDNHIIKKHPDFIASISRKVYTCLHCTHATVWKSKLAKHMLRHFQTAGSYKLRCIHCNAEFKNKQILDDHTVRKHPDFIASISRKVYKCLHCTHATVWKSKLAKHMLQHFETARKLITCTHCDATLKTKQGLDEHIVKKHPDFIAPLPRKIYSCTDCTFKTVYKTNLTRHMSKHREKAGTYKFYTCIHCDMDFKSNRALDEHTVRKHPDFIASVSGKIHASPHSGGSRN